MKNARRPLSEEPPRSEGLPTTSRRADPRNAFATWLGEQLARQWIQDHENYAASAAAEDHTAK